jgi:LPXTG-motif cell wall-anchored protein
MLRSLSFRRSTARVAGVSVAALAVGAVTLTPALAAPALAAGDSACPDGSIEMAPGICEVDFVGGTSSWTPPAGTTQLQALLIGAGAAGDPGSGYGGGAGAVELVTLDVTGAVDIAVGAAGTSAGHSSVNDTSVSQNAVTTVAAGGGFGIGNNASGNGNSGWVGGGGAGGGADFWNGGVGVVVSTLTPSGGGTSLFADADVCFGGGGGASQVYYENTDDGTASCGGGSFTIVAGDPATYIENAPGTNSGGGGGALDYNPDGERDTFVQNGAAGAVVLRFAYTAPTPPPPVPGDPVLTLAPGFAVGDLAAGAPVNLSGSGLKPSSDWSAVVRSEPVTIAASVTDANGAFAQIANLPANLEPGQHTVTLYGITPANENWARVLYFTIGANGRITYVSLVSAQAVLPATGSDGAVPSLVAAGGFLLSGAAILLVVRARRRAA